MENIFQMITDLGFPITTAIVGGYFVFLTMKLILAGVLSSIKGLSNIIVALDNRVKVMNNDVIKLDTLVSYSLNLTPDTERIARSDGKLDARKD